MIENVAVIGAGTMGQSIATAFAQFGIPVHLFDIDPAHLDTVKSKIRPELQLMAQEALINEADIDQILDRITLFADLPEAVKDRDYILECIPEKLELKQGLFEELDQLCKPSAIFASNTSSLKLEEMIASLSADRKARTMVNHWYNPAHLIPIAELSYFGNTSAEVYQEVESLYERIGKQTVRVLKDVPGLVANRIQQAVAREVFSLIEMEVATPDDIDKALKFGPAFRYATTGQLEIADFGGLDIWAQVGDNLLPQMSSIQGANPLLSQKVEEGKLGFKSGQGFYEYSDEDKDKVKIAYYKKLINQIKASKHYE